MPLVTTVIGSYPAPEYLHIPKWFPNSNKYKPGAYTDFLQTTENEELEKNIERAEKEIIDEQIDLGIDVITDGELRRENYIWYFCRHVKAFDFQAATKKECRPGGWNAEVPLLGAKIEVPDDVKWMAEEWQKAQAKSSRRVKMTIPGPMTITHSCRNMFYSDERDLSNDLVAVINAHVLKLVEAGCKHVQLDEPLFAREPEKALAYGIEHAKLCFKDVSPDVTTCIHLCRGYPTYLDQEGYPKADPQAYFKLAGKLDDAGFQAISIEDAECHNDTSLFKLFQKSRVILGTVRVARSRVESTEEIRTRLQEVMVHLPADRIIVAPDCGLGFLPRDIMKRKLSNMVAAAKSL